MFTFFLLLFCTSLICGQEIYMNETFPDENSISNWISSKHHDDKQGEFKLSAGDSPVDPDEDRGLKTTQDAKYYGITRKLSSPFSNRKKTLVVQYTVKYDKSVDCGGAYIKLLGSDFDQEKFHGETPYKIMFGPDICGISKKKVHVIFNYKGQNHLINKEIRCKDDLNTHLYTLILTPDNQYEVLIDNERVEQGKLDEDWDMLPPKKIDDTTVSKPDDWVDEDMIEDPDDKKPDDWDKPKTIPDMDAKKPDDWDDEMDGEWERPQKDNPEHKGEWKPKRIPNPKYKGVWKPPQIDNPKYFHDSELYAFDDIGAVGFDLWQVASGSIFDNILITDSPALAKEEGERLWRKRHDAEAKKEGESKPSEKEEEEEEPEVDEPEEPEAEKAKVEPTDEADTEKGRDEL